MAATVQTLLLDSDIRLLNECLFFGRRTLAGRSKADSVSGNVTAQIPTLIEQERTMKIRRMPSVLAAFAACLALNACARPAEPAAAQPSAEAPASSPAAASASSATAAKPGTVKALPRILVHHSPTCGCCGVWVEHLRTSGFAVDVRQEENLEPIKQRLGVPDDKRSCHTAEVDGYFVEGHVPASDIKRLLTERPAAKGLALPGMPAGSPGMEMPDGRVDAYTVEQVNLDGSAGAFSKHGGTAAP